MLRLRPVLLAIGLMSALLGAAMLPCALIDFIDGEERWLVFTASAFFTLVFGGGMALLTGVMDDWRSAKTGQREAFLLTVLVWLVLPAFAALPFIGFDMSFTDAVFESVSGLTTTGSTVMTGLDETGRGLLLWRAILQWIGGIGIIVTAIAILPMLRVGGMQLFQLESSDVSGKFLPSVAQIAAQTGYIYVGLSVLCAVLYAANGMSAFDAIAHAMTTMAAGGYSTHDASMGYFGNGVESVGILFMLLAGMPFAAFVLLLRGQTRPLLRDPQIHLFLALIIGATLILLLYNNIGDGQGRFRDGESAIRTTLFNVVSVMTGTGYASTDYGGWGPGSNAIFLILMFLGGCAGSAACGIKMFRLEISFRAAMTYTKKMTHPHRVLPVRYAGRVVGEDTLQSVMVFVFLYLTVFVVSSVLLGLSGLDPITAISAAATSVSNVGPGLGPVIGPAGTFESLPVMAKWICVANMLLGRLEFIAVFVVLTRRFWRG